MKVKVSYSPTLSEVNEVDLTIENPTRGEWIIGRSPDSDLLLDSPDISRVHAKFFVKSGNYYFSDLGSRNGSIFNGKQAEKDRPYSLSDGDVIRIADYVLILEAVAPAYEQPETVFRIIDPSLFSRPRSPENVSASNVATPAPEVVNEVPAPINQEVETPELNVVSVESREIPEVISTQPDDAIPVVEVIVAENIIQPPEAVSEVPHDVHDDEFVDWRTLLVEEVNADSEEVEIPEVEASKVSLTEPDEIIATPENIIETPEEESSVPEATHSEVVDLEAALAAESTFVQPRDISATPEATDDEYASEAALEAEVTSVQPRDIFHQVSEEESAVPEATNREILDLDTPVAESPEVAEDVDIQPPETLSQVTPNITNEAVLDTPTTTEDTTDVEEVKPSSTTGETVNQVFEVSTTSDENVPQVFSNQYTEEVRVNVDNVSAQESEVYDLADIQSLQTTETGTTESISQPIEEVSEVEVTQLDETPEDINVSEPPQTLIERNIVLIAHESKKSELAEFVSQHQEFFSQSFTITWPSVSEVLHEQAGITISQQTPAPTSGGYQTIASLVGAGEILAVIFLRDLLQPQPGQANEEALLRLCTINQVLLATNLPTAEAIVHYLKHI
ncbi:MULTISPECIES: FHA domain-containing protein [unclassified Nostoc]|uniref:FHA domain-containing protein n=1 Tax=unclassified Nostoc TaxID=2593658 RepID=UPI002AD201CC|nr:FHA domain-containing protein [Nostoc sp. DedQUE03]MDZ7975241.1 FHA domain-containing protein [Nostoc sp. DedQUE03]MDZ8048856.1 FHA domain-containing protein [Nostoc sp. DedQUE02]